MDGKSIVPSGAASANDANDEVTAGLMRQTQALQEISLTAFESDHNLWSRGAIPLETLCLRAGDAFDACARATFDALRAAGKRADDEDAPKWMRQHYRRALLSVAHGIRDAIADSNARHTVAQTLQTRMLRAETQFRQLTDEPGR